MTNDRAVSGKDNSRLNERSHAALPIGAIARQILELPIAALKTNPRNAREHNAAQLKKLGASLRTFSFINPIIVDESDMILVGHGRLEAAKQIGLKTLPVIRVTHLSATQKRAYVLADNRLAEDATWNLDTLAIELKELRACDEQFVPIIGFEPLEIATILEPGRDASKATKEALPGIDRTRAAVSRPGDLWQLGAHTLLCGDARDHDSYKRLLASERAALVIVDPPEPGQERGLHLNDLLACLVAVSREKSIHCIFEEWHRASALLGAAEGLYARQLGRPVWVPRQRSASAKNSRYQDIYVFRTGKQGAPASNACETTAGLPISTNSCVALRGDGGGAVAVEDHPLAKPASLFSGLIKQFSSRGAIVLDPFCGSGTTICAGEQLKRAVRAMEIDPAHVDFAIRRWEFISGEKAVLAQTKSGFEEIARRRRVSAPSYRFVPMGRR